MDNATVLYELQRGFFAQGVVRSYAIIYVLPLKEFSVKFRHFPRAIIDLIELLRMGSIGPFNGTVELGTLWREDEQPYVPFHARPFEIGEELRAPVHLYGFYFKGHTVLDGVEKLTGGACRGPAPGLYDIPLGYDISRRELLQYRIRHRPYIKRVYLHQVSRC